eukprot:2178788-Alexandrium_andersonii.AAC.1
MKLTELFTGAALGRAAPTRRPAAWAAVRAALESAGAMPGSLRSWQALYLRLRGRPAPKSLALRELLADHALDALSSTGRPVAPSLGEVGVFNWNVRWLVNPSAAGDTTSKA